MTLAEKIAAKNQRLVAIKDRLTELKGLAEADDKYEFTNEENDEMVALSEETDGVVKSIESLDKMEKALAAKAQPVKINTSNFPDAKTDKKMDLIVKEAVCSLIGFTQHKSVEQVANEIYKGQVNEVLAMQNKTAVAGADSTTAGWAAELVRQQYAQFMDLLHPVSVFAKVSAMGITVDLTKGPVTFPSRTNGSKAQPAWVGEQGVIPVGRLSLGAKVMSPTKLAVIMAMSREIIQQSVPQIESVVRQAILDDTAEVIDAAFLASTAAVAGVRPAGILDGITGVASAGTAVADIITDIKTALKPMTTANMGAKPVLLMNSNTALGLASLVSAVGMFIFRDEIVNSGTLLGVPIVTSTNVPADVMIAMDAAAMGYGIGAPMFDTSESATLTMANADGTAPTQALDATGALGTENEVLPDGGISVVGGVTGAGSAGYQAQSMFQTYQLALRAIVPTNWTVIRTGGIGLITGIAW